MDTPDSKTYVSDFKTQRAVERQLGIIREALNQLKKIGAPLNFGNTEKIIGLRNRLIHGYDSIDNAIIWSVVQNHIEEKTRQYLNN